METDSSTGGTKKAVPKIVKLDKAFKLAEMWVKNMSKGTVEENKVDVEIEGRPSRLGLGARIAPNAKKAPSTDPAERKLLSKVNAKRRQNSENEEKMNSTEKTEFETDDDTDESESRTSAVAKKRPMPLSTAAALVKRHK